MPGIVLSAERIADVFGVHRRTIAEWLAAGCPGVKAGSEWRLNTADVSAWRLERGRQLAAAATDPADAAALRKLEAEADIAELKARRARGELVEVEDVRKAFRAIGRMYGAARENLPVQLAPLLVGKQDLAEIEAVLRHELRAADERVADEIEGKHGELVLEGGDGDGLVAQ